MSKLLLVLTVFLISPFILLAQTRTIKGKVVDEAGSPVANANILTKGSKKGTQTDKDGNFSITVSGNGSVRPGDLLSWLYFQNCKCYR